MTGRETEPTYSGTVGDYVNDREPTPPATDRQSEPAPSGLAIAFVDSSAMVALADAGDASHTAAVAAYRELVEAGYLLFTTDIILAETYDLLRSGHGFEVARQWLKACRIAVYPVEERDLTRARQRLLAADLAPAYGLADAVSLVVMDRLGVTDVFAVDQTVLNASA